MSPRKSPHPCKIRNCAGLAESGESYCPTHQHLKRDEYKRKHPEHQKMYSRDWGKFRKMYLAEHPLCVNWETCHNAATVVDHIQDHEGDWEKFWELSNLQPMCAQCHNVKTAKTKGFGKQIDD